MKKTDLREGAECQIKMVKDMARYHWHENTASTKGFPMGTLKYIRIGILIVRPVLRSNIQSYIDTDLRNS